MILFYWLRSFAASSDRALLEDKEDLEELPGWPEAMGGRVLVFACILAASLLCVASVCWLNIHPLSSAENMGIKGVGQPASMMRGVLGEQQEHMEKNIMIIHEEIVQNSSKVGHFHNVCSSIFLAI